jgi:phosphoribosylamine--glycine ligase
VVIEINCRFGDPEAQLLMPLLDCELLPYLQATTITGMLRMLPRVKFKPEVAVGIVLASEGYPDDPKVGRVISGLRDDRSKDDPEYYANVYHAGTKIVDGQLVTAGGRVLTVVGMSTPAAYNLSKYQMAKRKALIAVGLIHFEGEYHRTDIADEIINS